MIKQINLNHVLKHIKNFIRGSEVHRVHLPDVGVILTIVEAILDDHGGSPFVS
jgi:hypothetical protein